MAGQLTGKARADHAPWQSLDFSGWGKMISRTDAPVPEIFRPQCLLLCDISRIRGQRFGIAFGGEAATLPVKSGPDL